MEALAREWVLRIFERLDEIYKERWHECYENESDIRKSLIQIQWSTGLSGLSPTEIRRALQVCQNYPHAPIPTVVEFYHYAKGIRAPIQGRLPLKDLPLESKRIAAEAMAHIRTKLSIKPNVSHRTSI